MPRRLHGATRLPANLARGSHGLLRDGRALLDGLGALGTGGLGALGNGGALFLLGCSISGHGTESEGGGGHQRHQFLHLAVLLVNCDHDGRLG